MLDELGPADVVAFRVSAPEAPDRPWPVLEPESDAEARVIEAAVCPRCLNRLASIRASFHPDAEEKLLAAGCRECQQFFLPIGFSRPYQETTLAWLEKTAQLWRSARDKEPT